MKSLLLGIFASLLLSTSFASVTTDTGNNETELPVHISFTVVVTSGAATLDGATVSVIQNGNVVSTGTTMRGKANVYIENDQPFTLKVVAASHQTYSKEIGAISQNDQVKVPLVKLAMKGKTKH
jgi:hypothetical protein